MQRTSRIFSPWCGVAVVAIMLLGVIACEKSNEPPAPQPTATPAATQTPTPTPEPATTPAPTPDPSVGEPSTPTAGGSPSQPQSSLAEAQARGRVSAVRSSLRAMATACEAYNIDFNAYPEFVVSEQSGLPSYRWNGGLTTPIAYIKEYPVDPFAPKQNATFLYWKLQKGRPGPSGEIVQLDLKGTAYIAISAGPDRDYDLAGEWNAFDPMANPPIGLLTGTNKKGSAYTYDPTNGTFSDGDLWWSSTGSPSMFRDGRPAGAPGM